MRVGVISDVHANLAALEAVPGAPHHGAAGPAGAGTQRAPPLDECAAASSWAAEAARPSSMAQRTADAAV